MFLVFGLPFWIVIAVLVTARLVQVLYDWYSYQRLDYKLREIANE